MRTKMGAFQGSSQLAETKQLAGDSDMEEACVCLLSRMATASSEAAKDKERDSCTQGQRKDSYHHF